MAEQLKLSDEVLQPADRGASPEVTDKSLAGLPSSVVKVTVTTVLLPVRTASEL